MNLNIPEEPYCFMGCVVKSIFWGRYCIRMFHVIKKLPELLKLALLSMRKIGFFLASLFITCSALNFTKIVVNSSADYISQILFFV